MFIVWIVAFMVHSTVLLGLAWLVSRALEGRPRATAALWRAALVAPLVTATLQVWAQPDTAWRWSLTEPPVARVESGFAPEPDALAWAIAPPMLDDIELAPAMADAQEPVLATPAAVLEVAPQGEPPTSPWNGSELFGAFWLLGALLGLAGIVAGALRLRSQLAGRRPFAAPWPSHALGPAPRVDLCVAPKLRAPLVYGVWRPEVCVPSRALVELDEDSLRAIVAHELGHVVHRDPLWRWIGLVLERVFFFQPLLRLGNRELTAASELLADAWAVGRTHHPLALAESLTVVAAWVQARALPSPAPAMAGQRSQLWRRVERLVDQDAAGRMDPWPRWLAPGLAIVVAGLVAFAPGVSANAMCPRVMSGFEFDPETHAAVIAAGHAEGGPTVIVLQNEPEVADAKSDRKSDRATAKERRKAKKRVKQVFKKARKRGDLPSEAELAAAVHGSEKRGGHGQQPVVVVIGQDGRRAMVHVDPRALGFQATSSGSSTKRSDSCVRSSAVSSVARVRSRSCSRRSADEGMAASRSCRPVCSASSRSCTSTSTSTSTRTSTRRCRPGARVDGDMWRRPRSLRCPRDLRGPRRLRAHRRLRLHRRRRA
jgi:hypothetical protein